MEFATIFEHRDFTGRSQNVYIGITREENIVFGGYNLSSLKVPFGLNVTLSGNWEGNGHNLRDYYPGDYPYVGNEINDQTRSIVVLNKSIFYAVSPGSVVGNIYDIHKNYPIPEGYTVEWNEITKAGDARWQAKIEENRFYIDIWVRGDGGQFSGRSWCGVEVRLVEL